MAGVSAASEAPRVQLKVVDAGDLYLSWRWEHALDEPRVVAVPRDLVRPVLEELAAAVPSPLPGEDVRAALERAAAGPLGDPTREAGLAARLASALVPARLGAELAAMLERGRRPHLRIQPSPSLARVPWEAMLVDEGRRLVHEVDVSMLPPASVRNAVGRRVPAYDRAGPVVAVLDPLVPGGALAPVLAPPAPGAPSPVAEVVRRLGARRRGAEPAIGGAIDRDRLRTLLAGASRLLYVGHVTGGEHGLGARLHLSDDVRAPGLAEPMGAHRPLAAADLAFADPPWRIPARVALVACESGGDARFAEPTGLVAVLVRRGAEHVTAARWTLPTDAGFAAVASARAVAPDDPPAAGPFAAAVAAVDAAHETADPVAAMCAWQRAQAERWASTGAPEHSPMLWAALTTAWAPGPWTG